MLVNVNVIYHIIDDTLCTICILTKISCLSYQFTLLHETAVKVQHGISEFESGQLPGTFPMVSVDWTVTGEGPQH